VVGETANAERRLSLAEVAGDGVEAERATSVEVGDKPNAMGL